MRTRSIQSHLLLIATVLAGCGGGGGSGGSTTTPVVTNTPPQPAFTVTPTSGTAPLTVTFDASSSNDPDGSIVQFTWSFGDNTADAVGSNTTHVYSGAGSFTARLTVTDNGGGTASRTAPIDVVPASGNFSLSGHIQVLPSSAIDSDVNDPSAPLTRNNAFTQAQSLPNPVSLGGYMNLPMQGRPGALQGGGDTTDKFRVSFAGGENVLLTVANPNVDVSMLLLDANQVVVDATLVNGGSGALSVPAAGDYFVVIGRAERRHVVRTEHRPGRGDHEPRVGRARLRRLRTRRIDRARRRSAGARHSSRDGQRRPGVVRRRRGCG